MNKTHAIRLFALFSVFYITLDLCVAFITYKTTPNVVKVFLNNLFSSKVLVPLVVAVVVTVLLSQTLLQ